MVTALMEPSPQGRKICKMQNWKSQIKTYFTHFQFVTNLYNDDKNAIDSTSFRLWVSVQLVLHTEVHTKIYLKPKFSQSEEEMVPESQSQILGTSETSRLARACLK